MSLLIQESPLQTIPSLAVAIGLNEAMVLQQLHYWVDKSKDGWVFNTYEQWQEQFPFWSTRTISRIFSNLEKAGYVKSKQGDSYYRVKYYTIDYEKVESIPFPKRSTCPDSKTSECRDQSRQDGSFNSLDYTETTTKDLKDTASSQKSDEPEYITIDSEYVKESKNSDNKDGAEDKDISAYDNDTYPDFTPKNSALSATRRPLVTSQKTLSKPGKLDPENNSDHYRFYLALCEVTDVDPNLQSKKMHGMSKKLMKAGYTIQDLKDFTSYWQRDWRYIRDKRAPSPEVLYTDINKSAKLYRESVQETLTEQQLKDMFVDGIIPEFLRQENNK